MGGGLPSLSDEIKGRLDHEPDVYVSAVTVWEVAIKQAIGKLEPAGLPGQILGSGFREWRLSAHPGPARSPVCHA